MTSAVVAERVPVNDELLPTATLPKFSDEGERARLPDVCADDCVPVPVHDWDSDESEALLVNETLPAELPGAVGVKTMV